MWLKQKKGQIEQWNRIKAPETHPDVYRHLYMTKSIAELWRNDSFSTNSAGSIGYPCGKEMKKFQVYCRPSCEV